MKKTTAVIMASLVAMITVHAASIESDVNLANRINLPFETMTVLTHIDVPPGEWTINGEANLFVYGIEGKLVHYGAYLSPQPTVDENNARVAIGSKAIYQNRIDEPIPLVGRRIQVNVPVGQTQRIYLTVYIWTDDNTGVSMADIYGFAHAERTAP